jgi:CPA2 family monovalent cation:H+ antiporter-2
MPHSVSLINTIAAGLGLALVFGFLAAKLRLPALVGYLLAGVIIGPFTPGFVADAEIAAQLAEIGVMLLMFGVGLHFSLDDLLAVRKIALPGALAQIAVATLLGGGLALWWGWSIGAALVFGLALSVASTVVLLRALESLGILDSFTGRIAIGWLVVEDLAMVLVLVLMPPLAGTLGGQSAQGAAGPADPLWQTLGLTLLQVGGFVALMLVVGRRVFPWILWQVTRTGSRELFTLCVVAAAVSIAFASAALFGVSFALGAFFAGMVMRESQFSHRAAQESLPLRDAFAVLFFVSVGMLFDPSVLIERPLQVLAVVGVIVLGKSLAACALVLVFRYPLGTALTVSASLAQIGEFSFILAGLGVSLGLLPVEGQSLVLAGALISIATNPLWFSLIAPCRNGCTPIRRSRAGSNRATTRWPSCQRHRGQVPVAAGGAGRLRPRRAPHCGRARRARHSLRGGRAEPRTGREAARSRHCRRVGRRGRPGRADPGAHRARPRAGGGHARRHERAPDDGNRAHAQPDDPDRDPQPQRARSPLLTQETSATVFLGEHELAQAMARDVVQRAVSMAMPA